MRKQLQQVAEFHDRIGEKCRDTPTLLDSEPSQAAFLSNQIRQIVSTFAAESAGGRTCQLSRRAAMALEELAEWIEAHIENNLVAAADALGDRLYVLLGDAVASGLPAEEIFEEIHRSNMTKRPGDARTGKGHKSGGYQQPILAPLIESWSTDGRRTCEVCEHSLWLTGIGQGVQCDHRANRDRAGKRMMIPNRHHTCAHFRRSIRGTADDTDA